MTNTFTVKYPSGLTETVTSDCASVEAYCNQHFGSSWELAKEHGASVEMAGQPDVMEDAKAPVSAGQGVAVDFAETHDEYVLTSPEGVSDSPAAPAELPADPTANGAIDIA